MKLHYTILAIGLSLLTAACQDTCLDTTGQASTEEQVQEALAQKQEALFSLLTAVTDLDSLPQNWNDEGFTAQVSESFGISSGEGTAHTRYVVTSSAKEADRIYRSLVSKDVTGDSIVKADTWEQEGVGSICFMPQNQADLYATMSVNVKQLPGLEEVRFVPASAVGDNASGPTGTYYQFGDVICQDIVSKNEQGATVHTPTLWVCVQPCNKRMNINQTYWCTLQMVPAGDDNSNYIHVSGTNNYLPTRLAAKKADAERMIQNYLNLTYYLAKPSCPYNIDFQGIGGIPYMKGDKDGICPDTLSAISAMWDYIGLWNTNFNFKIKSPNGTVLSTITKSLFNSYDAHDMLLDLADGNYQTVFYYGYNTNFFSKGNYTVYSLNGHFNSEASSQEVFKRIDKVQYYLRKKENFNFQYFEKYAQSNSILHKKDDNEQAQVNVGANYLIKCCTGSELEGGKASAKDIDPAHSFEKRNAQNRIFDILTSRLHYDQEAFQPITTNSAYTYTNDQNDLVNNGEEKALPYFAFGDKVSDIKVDGAITNSNFFCLKEANLNYDINNNNIGGNAIGISDDFKREAIFFGLDSKDDDPLAEEPTAEEAKIILYQLMQAYCTVNDSPDSDNLKEENLENTYKYLKEKIFGVNNSGLPCKAYEKDGIKNKIIIISFYTKEKYYTLIREKEGDKFNYTLKISSEPICSTDKYFEDFAISTENEITVYTYKDKYSFRNEFSIENKLRNQVNRDARKQLKTCMPSLINEALSKINVIED